MRRIFFQISILCGFVTFVATLWGALTTHNFDPLEATMRAVGSGMAILVFALLIFWMIEKLGAATISSTTPALPLHAVDELPDRTREYEEGN